LKKINTRIKKFIRDRTDELSETNEHTDDEKEDL
jgi:hypothetical protein